jgi:rhodanese-related sulfurtransferase
MIKLHGILLLLLSFLPFVGCVHNQNTAPFAGSTSNSGDAEITVKDIKQLLDNEINFTLIDSRITEEYAQSHLPTALSMPACNEGKHLLLLPEEKGQLLVFYCGWPACSMNTQAATFAKQAGYTNIRFMKDGLEGWINASFPTSATDNFVQKGHCILIDLRVDYKDTVQRIPRSVSIPFPTLTERVKGLPQKAVIVVYSDRAEESYEALAKLRRAGFTKVSMVEGNFQGWKQRENPITSGPIVTTVNWIHKPVKNEVTLIEFKKALKGKVNAVLLDVRINEEVATGNLLKTKHIPLEELTRRKNELPRNKKIFIHCSSGSRADMANRILRKDGYTSFALHATLECKYGDCELTN